MKILVIGGTYFLGRVFVLQSYKDFELTLVNRGNYSMASLGVKEYHFDRHDILSWEQLPNESYDAVVDFCAYQAGDIEKVMKHFQGQIKQYILVSTVDVYKRQTGLYKDEKHSLETRHFEGEVGEYIFQKVQLEKELQTISQKYDIPYTIIRPGNIYGPFNYAPRESEFIKYIVNGLPLIKPSDADALFQLVYVKDVAIGIIKCIQQKAYYKIYNIISNECIHYEDVYQCLINCSEKSVHMIDHTIEEIIQMGYSLPYPLNKEEEELYNGQLICQELGLTYTSLQEGMEKTYQAFLPIYQQ